MQNIPEITAPKIPKKLFQLKSLAQLAYLHGKPIAQGCIRAKPEDFYVQETLSFKPSGEGEHVFLYIEKCKANTEWVAKALAKHFKVRAANVAWAGLKDRNAVTRQWFSVHLPGLKDVGEWPKNEQFKVLECIFNNRKLRVGAIDNNFFRLRISDLQSDADSLQQRLQKIAALGVPNYFGEQRFGRNGNNLTMAQGLLVEGKRYKKSDHAMALSAARSYVFNQMLSQRIHDGMFNQVQAGDVVMLDKTKSIFVAQPDELQLLQQRLDSADCHISCAMPGSGPAVAEISALRWEQEQLAPFGAWLEGLGKQRVSASRRAARLLPQGFSWELAGDELLLEFKLPTGAYATSVLREFLDY